MSVLVTVTSAELSELARRLAPLLAPLVAREVAAALRIVNIPSAPTPPLAPAVLPMLTLADFAAVVGRHPEVIRRRIRGRRIPREMVDGPPYRLHPKALALFAVTPDIAADRLKARARPQP